ncbi:hypothetical protein, partial [Acidiphilium sp.]|uniref:hypothetical protein n=1 Tax=Acidiphilium sp. TaxID=527 RepID=UPI00258FFCC9
NQPNQPKSLHIRFIDQQTRSSCGPERSASSTPWIVKTFFDASMEMRFQALDDLSPIRRLCFETSSWHMRC